MNTSRLLGSGFGFGFGAFFGSFLPLSLLPMSQSIAQKARGSEAKSRSHPAQYLHRGRVVNPCSFHSLSQFQMPPHAFAGSLSPSWCASIRIWPRWCASCENMYPNMLAPAGHVRIQLSRENFVTLRAGPSLSASVSIFRHWTALFLSELAACFIVHR